MGRPWNAAVAFAVFTAAVATGLPQAAKAQGSVFTAADVDESQFVMVSAPIGKGESCLLYTSPSPRDATLSRMPSSA